MQVIDAYLEVLALLLRPRTLILTLPSQLSTQWSTSMKPDDMKDWLYEKVVKGNIFFLFFATFDRFPGSSVQLINKFSMKFHMTSNFTPCFKSFTRSLVVNIWF
jgi:hypothetical protein